MATPQSSGPRRDLFGDIAVAKGLLTWAKVRDALKRQAKYKEMGIPIRIGDVTVEMGLLDQSQCNDILTAQVEKRKTPVGEKKKIRKDQDPLEFSDDGEPFVLGRYRLEKRLGGVMGIVYRGIDSETNTVVALKVLPKNLAQDRAFIERFKREVRATSALSHPNIVNIFDAGVEQGIFYLATEFVDGESLSQRLRRQGCLSEREGLRIGREIALGLAHAHSRNILHRDVKPENVIISKTEEVKLADLGLAKFLEDEQRITADGIAVGTPHYISPEQARALKEIDHRSDLYSLGATIFHVVTGYLPYEGDNGAEVMKRHVFEATPDPRLVKPELSKPTAELLLKLMAKNPVQRYQTAVELVEHIDELLKKMCDSGEGGMTPSAIPASNQPLQQSESPRGISTMPRKKFS